MPRSHLLHAQARITLFALSVDFLGFALATVLAWQLPDAQWVALLVASCDPKRAQQIL